MVVDGGQLSRWSEFQGNGVVPPRAGTRRRETSERPSCSEGRREVGRCETARPAVVERGGAVVAVAAAGSRPLYRGGLMVRRFVRAI